MGPARVQLCAEKHGGGYVVARTISSSWSHGIGACVEQLLVWPQSLSGLPQARANVTVVGSRGEEATLCRLWTSCAQAAARGLYWI